MPLPPFAALRVSVNSGANQTGGVTCAGGETIALSADPAGALTSFKIEIYDYPPEFALPSGWSSSTDATGATIYSCTPSNGIAPVFTLDSAVHWWKYMFRLTGNNGDNGGNKNIPPSQLIDEKTAITVPAPSGLQQIGRNESTQFNANWNVTNQKNLRVIDTVASSAASSTAKAPAILLGTSNVALSGEQTIDGTLTSATRVLLVGQSTSSQNGLWNTAAGAWSRTADFNVDAQVVVGQTIFIKSGSLNALQNWQLTSGSTIAGAKSYAQLVSGSSSSVLQPVDAVDTTSNALTGTTAVDGVALTANVSRVLVVNQTTASQNGPWLVQVGAWTRPLDFAVDTQVVSGQSVYVKLGGALGGGTKWQLVSGSTIAGAKTYAKVNATGRPAVRAVQTAALPAFTYSAGVLTCTATAALAASVFDGLTLAINDRVELNGTAVGANIAATTNGIYFVSQVGDGSHQPKFTRVTDLNTTGSFVGGVSYEVTEGTIFKGRRRYLATVGVITLDTTSLLFDDIRSRDLLKIDLTQYPYNVRDQGADASDAINLALYNAQAAGFGMVELPHALGIFCSKPIKLPPLPKLSGQSMYQTTLNTAGQAGGYRVIMGNVPEPPHGPVVDSSQTYSLNLSDAVNPYWINLTHASELYFHGDNDFDCRIFCRFATGAITEGHIVSTRGRRQICDSISDMHKIFVHFGTIYAHLRTCAIIGGTPTYTTTLVSSNVTLLENTNYEICHKYDATNGHRLWVTVLGAAYAAPVTVADPNAAYSPLVTQFAFEETILGAAQNAGFCEDGYDGNLPGDATHGFYLGSVRYLSSLGNNVNSGNAPTTLGTGTGTIKSFFLVSEVTNSERGAYRDAGGALIAFKAHTGWVVPNRSDVLDTHGGHISNLTINGGTGGGVGLRVRQCIEHSVEEIRIIGNGVSGLLTTGPSFYGCFKSLRILSTGRFGVAHCNSDFPITGDTLIAGGYSFSHYVGGNSGIVNSGTIFLDQQGSPDTSLVMNGATVSLGDYRISDESSTPPPGTFFAQIAMVAIDGAVAHVTAVISSASTNVTAIVIGSATGYQGQVLLDCEIISQPTCPTSIVIRDTGVAPVKLGSRFVINGHGAPFTNAPGQIIGNGAIALADSDEVVTCVQGDWRDLAAGALATGVDRNKGLSAALPALKGQAIVFTWGVQAHALNIRNLTTGGTILHTAVTGSTGYARFVFDGTNWSRKEFSSQ